MKKRLLSLLLVIVMVLGSLPVSAFATASDWLTLDELRENYGAITVEAYNIGQGFLLEPSLYRKEDKCVGDITVELLTSKELTFEGSTSYFSGMEFDDSVPAVYPSYLEPYSGELETTGDGDGMLSQFDYSWGAGWCYTINDWWASLGANEAYPGQEIIDYNTGEPVTLGDVIRWHFTVYGYGSDCGFPGNAMGSNLFTQEDKSDLLFILAAVHDYYGNLDTDTVYETALAVAANPLATADAIAAQETALTSYIESTFINPAPSVDEAVVAVIEKIDAIDDEVTLESEEKIIAARTAFDALTDDQKNAVTNSGKLTAAESKLAQLKAEKAKIDAVIAKINEIGEVDLTKEDEIAAARTAYNNLDASLQPDVTNYSTLTAAETELAQLKAEKAKIDAVIAKINEIGEVDLTKEDEIAAARTAYNNLDASLQSDVDNYSTLTAAEAKLAQLNQAAADEVTDLIKGIGTVTLESEGAIEAARTAYDALTETQQGLVTNVDTLTAAEKILGRLQGAIKVYVTIADKGELVMVNDKITVLDLNSDANFTIDEILYAAHEAAYTGGAAAGYGSATGDYGLYITKLWGDVSGNYGYWLNDASCWSLADEAEANDTLVAFVYQNTEAWDSYSKFAKKTYTALAETAATVTVEKAGYDADWNTVFSAHKGADIKVYDADFKELNANTYKVTDNGDGTYAVTVNAVGTYTVVAYDNTTPLVPSICTLTVTNNADIPYADAVEDKISAIGTVTSASKTAIETARAAYDALTDAQKKLVSNYAVLTAAETALTQIDADKETADAVEKMINAIGKVTIYSSKKIKDARTAYDGLTASQKTYVENVKALTDAESTIAALYAEAAKVDHKAIFEATGKYISELGIPTVGETGGEWMIINLVRAGYACPEGYYENVVKYVRENINDKEQLHRAKSTDNSRVILALTAAGYDVTDVDGHNLLMGLTDMTYVKKQGINGPIWALIAFDSHDYAIPTNANAAQQVTRDGLISFILDKQLADGGWALSGKNADPDMTGMAIQALAPYYSTNAKVKAAVDNALACLCNKQLDNGGFGSIDGACSESCAQVIVALSSLGINSETDSRFVKNGVSVLDAMCSFAVDGGGFAHIPGGGLNGMATEQSQYALVSYFRFLSGKTSLYDMSDVTIRVSEPEQPTEPEKPAESEKPTEPEEVKTKLEVTAGGITAVPESLKKVGLETPEAVKKEITQVITKQNKNVDQKDIAHYDVTLMYTEDGGKTWIKADETHFPANGKITVTIPYPEGTDSSYTFTVVHMFTSTAFGKTPGDVELPKVTNTKDGIQFEVTGLSPISVGWTAPKNAANPETGDSTNILLIASVALVSLVGVAALAVADRKRKFCK